MKMDRQKSGAEQPRVPKNIKLSLLASALAAIGLLMPVLPASAAAPLPVPCGGCGNFTNTTTPITFPQAGTVNLSNTSSTNLTINQSSQTAILNWQSFNINPGYSVNFVQPSSTSSTLNKIWDAGPSTIAGSLTANGQIYLINQNGIIFANGAQINTGSLIASSLSITDSLYQNGYLTNVSGTPDFTGTGGFVRVDTGAVLNGSRIMLFAPVVENNGSISTPDGQTVLAAGNNIYLEASQDPNLRGVLVEVDVNNPGGTSSALNGLVQNNSSGTVTNGTLGNILAQRGNITLVGYAVNQEGILSATTAVNENGTIKLEARYDVAAPSQTTSNPYLAESAGVANAYDIRATRTGTVTLASGSAITIAPETASTATVTASQVFNPSIVEVMGNTIDMQSGSSITAPGGKVTLAALSSIGPSAPAGFNNNVYQTIDSSFSLSSFLNPNYLPTPNTGDKARVFLDSGSSIDVSGSTASVSVAQDILAVQLRGAELADAPLQKTGPLYGQTIYVDIRQGTPLANYSGEEAQIQMGVAQLTSRGGSVNLYSTGDVVAKAGSSINISGGQVDYTGAYVNTTSLISSTGVVYNIANASPNIVYDGIAGSYTVKSAKWGVTQTFNTMAGGDTRGRWDPGYVEGQAAGMVTVLAPDAAIEGSIIAKTVAGIYQTQPYVNPAATGKTPYYANTYQMLASGGSLAIGDSSPATVPNTSIYNYITNADVVLKSNPNPLPAGFGLGDALPQTQTIYLAPALWSGVNGVDQVGVYTNGTVTVNSGTSLMLAAGGSLTLQGDTVNMLGSISIPSGTVNLGAAETTESANTLPGGINIGSAGTGSTISTRGVWVNDSPLLGAAASSDPAFINGGNITINSGGNLVVAAGTVIDASGGAMVDTSNSLHGGNGGSISITGNYNQLSGSPANSYLGQLDNLDLASYGVAGGKGGALTLNAGDIVIGGTGPNALDIPVGFFSSGGFTSYTLGAIGGQNGLLVAPGSVIAPNNQTLILDNNALQVASGTDIYSFSQAGELPVWQRQPVSITLKQAGKGSGSLTVGAGATIQVDPKASINLTSDTQLTVLGTLDAPAGNIDLTLNSIAPQTGFNYGYSTLWLGSQSELLARGATILTPNAQGLQQGQVLSGGNINLTSNMFVVSQLGSLMDVSGTAANLDLPQLLSGSVVYRNSLVAGNAGSIAITATEGALLDGTMKAGVASGSSAAAGSFSLTLAGMLASDRTVLTTFPQNPLWEILVEPSGAGSFFTQGTGLQPVNDSMAGKIDLTKADGMAYVDAGALQQAGFGQVSLTSSNGAIALANQVALDAMQSITLDAPVISLAGNSASVSAAYVNLANSNLQNQTVVPPLAGTGILSVNAQMVDLTGNLSASGAGQLSITTSGDIRLNGVLDSAGTALTGSLVTQGNLTLQADQVYPTTMSQFALSVVDGSATPAGAITINPNNFASPASGSSPVLSAGGQVTLSAATINQDGVLKAPTGSITLGAATGTQNVNLGAGSLTSVSAEGLTIPYGSVLGGTGWIYNLTGSEAGAASGTNLPFGTVAVSAPPQKQINIQGSNVAINNGAVVNLSGGGDLYAYEFIPGTGGSVNVLDPTQGPANTYAIIPGMSGFAPYDPQLTGQYAASGSKSSLGVGSEVYLSGGNGLSAGYYSLLPASYALLPGAYMVTMVSGHQDMLPGQGVIQLPGGAEIMAGKQAVVGTDILAARWSGFEVVPGSVARTESQFQDSYANAFFASQAAANGTAAPPLPVDAGQLVVTANGSGATLALDGTFVALPAAGGQGAQVDLNVVGGGFDIVNGSVPANGLVQLDSNALRNMGVQSLLIGGVRSQTTSGLIIVGADQVVVDNAMTTTLSNATVVPAVVNGKPVSAVMVGGTTKLAVGESISGDGFPLGTIISSITYGSNSTTFVTSAADTNTNAAGVTLQARSTLATLSNATVVPTVVDGKPVSTVTVSNTTSLTVGESISGDGFPSGTTILSINYGANSTTFVTSAADTNNNAAGVTLQASSTLQGPEIILAATNAVTVTAGSSIQGSGTFTGQANNLTIGQNPSTDPTTGLPIAGVSGDGVLLRVSSGPQVTVTRNNLSGSSTPTLSVASGASVGGTSVLLDSSSATNIGNGAQLSASSFSVSAQNIAIGNPATTASTSTLLLSDSLLSQLAGIQDLILHSYGDIDFYGAASLGGLDVNQQPLIGNLTLNAQSISGNVDAGMNNASNSINASTVTLMNNNGTTSTTPNGTGNLTVNAGSIVMAGGNLAIQGYDAVTLNASGQIQGQGTGGLAVVAPADANAHTLQINAGQITGAAGSNQTILAANYDISLGLNSGTTFAAPDSLGANLTVSGNSITDSGIINLPTGTVTLNATGTGSGDGVTLAGGAQIIATGVAKTIAGQTFYAPAGSVTLSAASGGIALQSGSDIDVSANAGGGNAGSIDLLAANGQVTVTGNLAGAAPTATGATGEGGSFTVDAGSLAGTDNSSLTALNDTLTAGGFDYLRDIRVRSGDLSIAADSDAPRAVAQNYTLEADAGNIDIQGTINSSGANGGNILLAASGNVTVENGALLDAHATAGTLSGATVAGGMTVTVGSTANLAVGESLSGDGFPSGTTIASITNGTTFVTSAADTNANATGVALQAGSTGGNVTLETTAGAINLTNSTSAQIDVRGGTGGTVLLRAPQTQINGGTDLAVNTLAGTGIDISQGADVSLEGFKVYNQSNLPVADISGANVTIGATDVNTATSLFFADATNFANNAAAIKTRLGISTDNMMSVIPGVEIDSTGNILLNTNWNLSNWRFNDGTGALTEPGILTLRAAGNINIGTGTASVSLSDGFTSATSSTLLTSPSWSYRLVAGADMGAANAMAVDNTVAFGTGNVMLAAGKDTVSTSGSTKGVTTVTVLNQVRTGTGFIDIAAGGSVNLGNRDSVIYTAGLASIVPSYISTGVSSSVSNSYVFPVGGGDISISADGNINGDSSGSLPVNQLVSEWQWRQGESASNGAFIDPAWWINYGAFRQNIGALGGGNVSISAGGNINTLSAVVPTSGYGDSSGNTVVLGGGNLNVTAGGSINSGIFYVGNGEGTIIAGGGLGATSSSNPIYTILLMGGSFNNVQTGFNVQTAGDLNLQTVLNPTMLGFSFSQKPANNQISYFYTYDGAGNISLTSLGGNIQLVNSLSTSNNGTAPFLMNTAGQPNTVYPASLEVTALDGAINNNGAFFQLFPSSTGNLQLFAGTDINLGAGFGMSDMSPASLLPVNSAGGVGHVPNVSATSHGTVIDPATQLPIPVHANDTVPITIVASGDVTGNDNTTIPILELPKQTLISAGQDIIDVTADIQNQQPTDTTSFVAGRDITYTSQETAGIIVSGPGQVVLQAGRNVNLGVSAGVVTEGSLNNPALPSGGASITVLAGAGKDGEDPQAFISKYIDPATQAGQANIPSLLSYFFDPTTQAGLSNAAALTAFVGNYGAPSGITAVDAYAYLQTLPIATQTSFAYNFFNAQLPQIQAAYVNQAFFNELRASGRSAISTGNYSAGYAAIATLFPGSGYSGDINMYNSQIKTESGGDINILTPGGGADAGLASVNTGKPASQIGVVTVGGGNINAFVNNDFTVNQSRVFTIQGGNILMWSSNGSIDAGNGSKTATSTPPPLLVVNPKTGEFSVDATASIVGSGIRVLLGNRDVIPGTVDLFAPTGVINAGDAGIGSAGNIFLGAQQVIGANNINFSGTSAGVPVATVAPVSVSGMNNLQDASKAADQATQGMSNPNESLASFQPTFLSVEVIGLGSGDDCNDLQHSNSPGCN